MALETERSGRVVEGEAKFLGREVVDLFVSMHHGGGHVKTGQVTGYEREQPQIDVRQPVRRLRVIYGREYCALPL